MNFANMNYITGKEKQKMDLLYYWKSIVDMDRASIVICDLNHEILYMNPAAIRNYGKILPGHCKV